MEHNRQPLFGALGSLVSPTDETAELSERAYNRTIGLLLAYGFAINLLIIALLLPSIYRMIYAAGSTGFLLFIVLYFALCFGGNALLRSESTPRNFLGYTMIVAPVGVLLSIALIGYDPYLIFKAMLLTGIVTLGMMAFSIAKPEWFLRMGPALGVSLLVTIVVELAASFLFRLNTTLVDYAVVAIMALYVGFDWARANCIRRTTHNAIAVAASLYLDIVNILLRIVRILGRKRDN